MAAANQYALDIEQLQVAVAFDDDARYCWHHLNLMVKFDGDWRWVVATPTHDVQIMDLSDYNVAPLSRGRPIPRQLRGSFFGCDPVTHEQMQELMGEARLVAEFAAQCPASDPPSTAAPRAAGPSDEGPSAPQDRPATCEAGIWRW